MRVTSMENPHIINKTQAAFENYWSCDDFEPIDDEDALKRFEDAIWKERHKKSPDFFVQSDEGARARVRGS